jgi:hypothetical protein
MPWTPFEEDDFWFPEGVPTFTLEEYLSSVILPNPIKMWTDKTGETMTYFTFNTLAAAVSAYRAGGNTFTAYKMLRAAQLAPPLAVAASPLILYQANKAIIESAPPEQQQSLWQIFAQAISGTGQPGVRHSYGS